MTPEKVSHAVQVAYRSLKFWSEDWEFWRKAGGYLHAELIAAASVRLILPGAEVIERNGYEVLYDLDGQLVPKLAQYPEGPAIYDDVKGAAMVAKAIDGDHVAPKVLFWIAARFVESGCAMPNHLRRYVAGALELRSRVAPRANGVLILMPNTLGMGTSPRLSEKSLNSGFGRPEIARPKPSQHAP